MALYTSNYLKNLAGNKSLNESIRIFSELEKAQHSFDIFLCHSFLDKDEVKGLYFELTKAGFSVYVDWIIDKDLDRDNVTKESAELIRKRLRSSKTLLLALSANAKMSKWVPWELGYVDGHTQQCGLIPVSQDNIDRSNFERTEYLKLYPFIDKPNDLSRLRGKLFAVENANHYVELGRWIRGNKPAYEQTRYF